MVFEQTDVEIPKTWSQLATNVVVSKYFRGPIGTPQRERSVRQMINRITDTMTAWGREQGYFSTEEDAQIFHDELTHIILNQKATFNSPVWFNMGVDDHPQCSACFILSADDSMEAILEWCKTEGMIFKGGSGAGVNLSKIRSSKETLSSGGQASGPVSFMRAADSEAILRPAAALRNLSSPPSPRWTFPSAVSPYRAWPSTPCTSALSSQSKTKPQQLSPWSCFSL